MSFKILKKKKFCGYNEFNTSTLGQARLAQECYNLVYFKTILYCCATSKKVVFNFLLCTYYKNLKNLLLTHRF